MASYAKIYEAVGAINQYDLIASTNIALTGTTASTPIDGVIMTAGMYVALTNQTTSSQDGVYIVNITGANYTLVLFASLNTTTTNANPIQFSVAQGKANKNTLWQFALINGVTNFNNITYSPSGIVWVDGGNGNDSTGNGSYGKPFATPQTALNYVSTNSLTSIIIMLNPVADLAFAYAGFDTTNLTLTAIEISGGYSNNTNIGDITIADGASGNIDDITISNLLGNNLIINNTTGNIADLTINNCGVNAVTIDNIGTTGIPSTSFMFNSCYNISGFNIFNGGSSHQAGTLNLIFENHDFQDSGFALAGATTQIKFLNVYNLPSPTFANSATPSQISLEAGINIQTTDYIAQVSDFAKQIDMAGTGGNEIIIDITKLPAGFTCTINSISSSNNVADNNDMNLYPPLNAGESVSVFIDSASNIHVVPLIVTPVYIYLKGFNQSAITTSGTNLTLNNGSDNQSGGFAVNASSVLCPAGRSYNMSAVLDVTLSATSNVTLAIVSPSDISPLYTNAVTLASTAGGRQQVMLQALFTAEDLSAPDIAIQVVTVTTGSVVINSGSYVNIIQTVDIN